MMINNLENLFNKEDWNKNNNNNINKNKNKDNSNKNKNKKTMKID